MQIKPEETQTAVRWINDLFDCNGRFPACCAEQESTNFAIRLQQVKACKDWTKTPATIDAINHWADNWLNAYALVRLRGQ